jgi:hypothetical protein
MRKNSSKPLQLNPSNVHNFFISVFLCFFFPNTKPKVLFALLFLQSPPNFQSIPNIFQSCLLLWFHNQLQSGKEREFTQTRERNQKTKNFFGFSFSSHPV